MGQVSAGLNSALAQLFIALPELEAAAVVSFDGLPMATALPPSMQEERVAAMSAALLSLGEKAAAGLGRGDLAQVYIEGTDGTVLLVSARDQAVLVAVAPVGAKSGLTMYEVKLAADRIGEQLQASAPRRSMTLHEAPQPLHAQPLHEAPRREEATHVDEAAVHGTHVAGAQPLPRGWARYGSSGADTGTSGAAVGA